DRLPLKVSLPFRLEEEVIHRLVRVTREVAGASRIEELEEEVVRMRHIGGPRVEKDRELALGKSRRERRPVRLVMEFSLDAHRLQILLDLLMLLKELLVSHTGPDRDRGKTATPRVSRLGEKLPG